PGRDRPAGRAGHGRVLVRVRPRRVHPGRLPGRRGRPRPRHPDGRHDRVRHRARRVPPPPGRDLVALDGLRLLRPRRHGRGRPAACLGAQARRPGGRAVRRAGRAPRRRGGGVTGTTATQPSPPPDQAARDRIVGELDRTLFVQAGAGAGKTRALVDRIVRLVTTGTAGLEAIAAITFTEKAATELRDRVRRRLEDDLADAVRHAAGERAARCRTALADLDRAAIRTLHGFAQRILTEHPVEAGLPPRIEVLDEVASAVAFDERWSRFVDRLLEDAAVERALLHATAAGVRVDHLRLIA